MLQKALSRNFHEIIKESPWSKVKPHWSFIHQKKNNNNTAIFENSASSARGKLYFAVTSWWPETSNQPIDEFIIPSWVSGSHISLKVWHLLVSLWCGRTGTWLPNLLGWIDNQTFLSMGLRSCALHTRVEVRYHRFYRLPETFCGHDKELYRPTLDTNPLYECLKRENQWNIGILFDRCIMTLIAPLVIWCTAV